MSHNGLIVILGLKVQIMLTTMDTKMLFVMLT
jgi:hypothetical protein